jgi:hypothetical protein
MISRNHMLVAAVIMLGVVLSPTPAEATIYYVSKKGNDANPCTSSQPCLTITRGIAVASSPGDIIDVGAGIYDETLTLTHSGSAGGGKIVLRGYSTDCPTISSSDPYTPGGVHPNPSVLVNAVAIQANYVRVECLDVSGAIYSSAGTPSNVDVWDNYIHPNGDNGIVGNGSNWLVLRNHIYYAHYGILFTCSASCTFQDNDIDKLRAFQGQSGMTYMRGWGAGLTIRHNYFHGADINDCYGGSSNCHIDCFHTFNEGAHDVIFDRNVCFNSHAGVILQDASSSTYGTYCCIYNWTITNNLIGYGPNSPFGLNAHPLCVDLEHGSGKIQQNDCIGGFMWLNYGSQATSIENNIINHSETTYCYTPILIENSSQPLTERNNILTNNGSCTITGYPNDLKNVDPTFVNEASTGPASDFRLQSSSPAIDAGSAGLGITSDLDGNTRDSHPDIGAYEFGSATSSLPVPPTSLRATVY